MKPYRSIWLIGLLVAFMSLAPSAWAGQVRMTVKIGFGGYAVPGRWMPLKVAVEGINEPAMVEIHRENRPGLVESYPCPVPSNGPTVLECPVYADPTGEVFDVRLVTGRQIIAEERIKTYDKIFPGHIVLVLHASSPVRQAVSQALMPGEPVMALAMEPSDFPNAVADYDGISCIIAGDPEASFNPAQRRALRIWLSGGGRMVLPEQAASENFGDLLTEKAEKITVGRVYPVGFGRLALVPENFADSGWAKDPRAWKDVLQLKTFNENIRLTDGEVFRYVPAPLKKPRPVPLFIWLFPAVFGLGAILVGVMKTSRTLRYLLLTAVLGLAAAVPVGRTVETHWQRGAVAVSRMLILPSGDGLVDCHIQLPRTGVWDLSGLRASSWGVNVESGRSDEGVLYAGGDEPRAEWRHREEISRTALAFSDPRTLRFIGWLSKDAVHRGFARAEYEETALWIGGRWKTPISKDGSIRWVNLIGTPEWLAGETDWCRRMTRLAPDIPWLFGRRELDELNLRLQSYPSNRIIWAKPLLKEGKP